MAKSETDLHEDVEVFDMVERYAGWLVVAGLIIELAHAFVFRQGKSWFEDWGPSTANLFVVIGVWLEIFFAGHAKEASAALDRLSEEKVAAANARADEANAHSLSVQLELDKYKSPRLISDEQFDAAVAILKKFSGQWFVGTPYWDNPESYGLYMRLLNLLSEAGWLFPNPMPKMFLAAGVVGIYVNLDIYADSDTHAAGEALIAVLAVIGLKAAKSDNSDPNNRNRVALRIGTKN